MRHHSKNIPPRIAYPRNVFNSTIGITSFIYRSIFRAIPVNNLVMLVYLFQFFFFCEIPAFTMCNRDFQGRRVSITCRPYKNVFTNDDLKKYMDTDDAWIQERTGIKERRYANAIVNADKAARAKMIGNKNIKLSALGAGSDWSGFLQFLGIASLNLGFGGEGSRTGLAKCRCTLRVGLCANIPGRSHWRSQGV